MLKKVHPYGHAHAIQMGFPKWQQMVIALIALKLATALGVLSLYLFL